MSQDNQVVSPDFATFASATELANRRLLAVNVPFGLGSLLSSGWRGQKCPLITQNH